MENLIKTELITDYITKNKLTKTKFCKLCNISYSVYVKIMSNQYNFCIVSLFKIAKLLNIEVKDLCNKK